MGNFNAGQWGLSPNSVGNGRGLVVFRKSEKKPHMPFRHEKILKADCGFGLDHSKSSDALLLRCSDAEVGQDRASGFDRPSADYGIMKSNRTGNRKVL